MRIKRLNEQQYFSQSFSGDGYNTSNGVFKVSYKPYDDLSISKGRDSVPSQYIRGQEYAIGDLVRGKITGSEEPVSGKIVSMIRNPEATEYKIKVKSDATNKVFPVILASVELVSSTGFAPIGRGANVDQHKDKMALSMKYSMGGLVWGKLESASSKGDVLLTDNGKKITRKGILDNSLTLSVVTQDSPHYEIHQQNFKKLGIAYMDTNSRTIYIDGMSQDFQSLTDSHLLTIEAHEIAHNMIKNLHVENEEVICDLVAAKILRNKGYTSAYKIIVSNFMGRHNISYGESLDANQKTVDSIIK